MSDIEQQKELAWTCADYILEGEGRHWLEQFRKDLPKNYAIEEPDYGGHESGGDGIVWPLVKLKKSVAGHAYTALKVSFRHSGVGTLPAGVGEGLLQKMAFTSLEKAGLTAGHVPDVFHHESLPRQEVGPPRLHIDGEAAVECRGETVLRTRNAN
jgi:hypothetical protein